MTRTERLLRLARLRGDRAAELIVEACSCSHGYEKHGQSATDLWVGEQCACCGCKGYMETRWTEAELRAAWGDR